MTTHRMDLLRFRDWIDRNCEAAHWLVILDEALRLTDVVENPQKWQAWCDHRVLERAEAAETRARAAEARVVHLTQEIDRLTAVVAEVIRSAYNAASSDGDPPPYREEW